MKTPKGTTLSECWPHSGSTLFMYILFLARPIFKRDYTVMITTEHLQVYVQTNNSCKGLGFRVLNFPSTGPFGSQG